MIRSSVFAITIAAAINHASGAPLAESIYWWSPHSDVIARTPLPRNGVPASGTPQDAWTDRAGGVNDMTVDSVNRRVYWFNRDGPGVFRLYSRGINDASTTEVLVSGSDSRGLCVDPHAGFLYWHDDDFDQVRRCELDGSNETVVFSNVPSIGAMTLDTRTQTLYWSLDGAGDFIQRGQTDGSGRADFIQLGFSREPISLAIDPVHDRLVAATSGRNIEYASLSGTPTWQTVYQSGGFPLDLDVDPGDGSIYWTEPNGAPPGHRILQLTTGAALPSVIFQDSGEQPQQLALLVIPNPGTAFGLLAILLLPRQRR